VAKGKAKIASEAADLESAIIPGQKFPEHECGLSDHDHTDLWRWRRQRWRKAARGQ
jgi:hypothetical protein